MPLVRLIHAALWIVVSTCCAAAQIAGPQPSAAAMDKFERVLNADPSDAAALQGEREAAISGALQLRRGGKDAEALLCLERARRFLPDNSVLLTDLGVLADALHHYKEAADALEAALTRDPGSPTAEYALARTEADRNRPTEAEPLFRAYLAQRPGDASAHYGLGRLLQLGERTEEAAAEFHRSIALQPVQTEAYFQLGQMALDAHRDEEAGGFFAKTLARLPKHGGALAGIGILDYRRKQYTGARQSLEAAVASSPDYSTAHYYLGLTLERVGDREASRRELGLAKELTIRQQDMSRAIGDDSYPPHGP